MTTELFAAIQKGDAGMVKDALEGDVFVNAENKNGFSALMEAAYKGHLEIVEILLKAGANPNLPYKDGWTALMEASHFGHLEIVKILLAAGANPNSVTVKESYKGITALMWAAQGGHPEIVKVLLDAAASPNALDGVGETAFDIANKKWSNAETQEKALDYKRVVELLLAAGAIRKGERK